MFFMILLYLTGFILLSMFTCLMFSDAYMIGFSILFAGLMISIAIYKKK